MAHKTSQKVDENVWKMVYDVMAACLFSSFSIDAE
jgi:hypothetical protein